MDLSPKEIRIHAVSTLPPLPEINEIGTQVASGCVMSVGLADAIYGADEGTQIAFVLTDAHGLVPVALDKNQSVTVGHYVRVEGWHEALTAHTPNGILEMGVLAALAVTPS